MSIYGYILEKQTIKSTKLLSGIEVRFRDKFKKAENRKDIEDEVEAEVKKIIQNEKKLLIEIFNKKKDQIDLTKQEWSKVKFDLIEIVEPEDEKDKFDLWAYTSREQLCAKIKNGKILKVQYSD